MVLKVDYYIEEKQRHLYTPSNVCLLDALDKHQVRVNNNCRQGHCGQCVLKLHKGHVIWRKKPLTPLNNDQILACCCMPATDITISK